jgi:hypothetical protein
MRGLMARYVVPKDRYASLLQSAAVDGYSLAMVWIRFLILVSLVQLVLFIETVQKLTISLKLFGCRQQLTGIQLRTATFLSSYLVLVLVAWGSPSQL